MKHDITCPRCGHTEALSSDACRDWDEINCLECGEFIGTRDEGYDLHSRNYRLHTLSLSLDLAIQMTHENACHTYGEGVCEKVA